MFLPCTLTLCNNDLVTRSHAPVQELVVSICDKADVEDGRPEARAYWDSPYIDGDDVTSLLQMMPALPSLRAARITAVRRSVGPVEMFSLSHLEHLALWCAELTLRSGGVETSMGPNSLHIITEKASPETVGYQADGLCPHRFISTSICRLEYTHTCFTDAEALSDQVAVLRRIKAVLIMMHTSSKGEAKWLEHWKAGLPHVLDLQLPREGRMVNGELWYENGFFSGA